MIYFVLLVTTFTGSKRDEDKIVPREIDADDSDVELKSDDERSVQLVLAQQFINKPVQNADQTLLAVALAWMGLTDTSSNCMNKLYCGLGPAETVQYVLVIQPKLCYWV